MFNFFKKKPTADASAVKQPAADLSKVEFHVMPAKFRRAASAMTSAHKAGLLIIIAGGAVLVMGIVLLGWYIYTAGRPATTAGTPSDNNSAALIPPENATAIVDQPATNPETAPEDTTTQDCGSGNLAADNELLDGSAWECLGERLQAGCLPALAVINDPDLGAVKFSVAGARQDKCLMNVDYGLAGNIRGSAWQIYANTSLQCLYDQASLSAMHYDPGHLAVYLYNQSSINSEVVNGNCSGTAIDRRVEQTQLSLAEAAGNAEPGVDTDGDGLTDMEETAVFATDINNADTDGDGYTDQSEVINLYNPAGSGSLADSGLTANYYNQSYHYSLLYPAAWTLTDQFNGESVFFFSGIDGSMQILAQDNPQQADIKSWYADLVGSSAETVTSETLTTKNGFEFIASPDGLTAYLTTIGGGSQVFVITYSPEQSGTEKI